MNEQVIEYESIVCSTRRWAGYRTDGEVMVTFRDYRCMDSKASSGCFKVGNIYTFEFGKNIYARDDFNERYRFWKHELDLYWEKIDG